MIQNPQPNVDDRQGQGVEGLIAAIALQAVDDLRNHRRHVREDAASFFYDGRFDLIATSLPQVDPDAAREKLRNRGLLPPRNGQERRTSSISVMAWAAVSTRP